MGSDPITPTLQLQILEEIKVVGNNFYGKNDCWRAIATYESGLAMLNMGTASPPSPGTMPEEKKAQAYLRFTRKDLLAIGVRPCALAVTFYMNIAQAYLQLAKAFSSTSGFDFVRIGHAVLAVSRL